MSHRGDFHRLTQAEVNGDPGETDDTERTTRRVRASFDHGSASRTRSECPPSENEGSSTLRWSPTREGDTLVVVKLEALAHSVRHLSESMDGLGAKRVTLRIFNFGDDSLDTRGATGRLMLNMFVAKAQFEPD